MVAGVSAFATVTYRVAYPIYLVGIFGGFNEVKLQIGQPVFGTLAFEIELMPLAICGHMYRLAVVGVGHDDCTGEELHPRPAPVVGVITLISFRPVMPIVVRLVNHEVTVVVFCRSIQACPSAGTLLDAGTLVLIRPEVSALSGRKNEKLEMHFTATGRISRVMGTTHLFTEIPISVLYCSCEEVRHRGTCQRQYGE